ncbi:MAG: DUF4080 domain-containing protein [Tannerella sp.]|jgi:radical SAM superfamily enzyme YgiQ (UPF0313 family)|nr:DUF4080 domain-containing protein [Tannerella sp.]
MKVSLTTINAKYIHTSLALRLLYVANRDRFDISFKEFSLKEDVGAIADELLNAGCDVIGLGVYIWNVKKTSLLVRMLKERKPDLIIILGGPEVTHEPAFFLENWPADFVISGEGEFVLGELLEAIKERRTIDIGGVSCLEKISGMVAKADLAKIAALPSPYTLPEDKETMRNKILYIESSRGCPFQCSYCLASLEKGVRFFPERYVFENLDSLIKNGARQIKFLDRTFNVNPQYAQAVFDFLLSRYRPDLSCQFEVYADLLHDRMIETLNTRLPAHFFRFEVGIQTTCRAANRAIGRKQHFPVLAANIRKLVEGGKIDLHLDLIAGLPNETFDRFIQSFNEVFSLNAKEVQLGFLKMLRGTALRKNAAKYGYRYDEEAPYEVRSHAAMPEDELNRIRQVENMLEKYWNSGRFTRTMQSLFDTTFRGKYFELFDEIATYIRVNQLSVSGCQLEDLFRHLHNFLISKGIDLFSTLRTDYYHCFTIRPQGFWEPAFDKKTKKRLLYAIGNDKDFLRLHNLNRKIIEKRTAIDPVTDENAGLPENAYQLTIFPEVLNKKSDGELINSAKAETGLIRVVYTNIPQFERHSGLRLF